MGKESTYRKANPIVQKLFDLDFGTPSLVYRFEVIGPK